jgi:septal ring factor EnvC (AmiA/AmiB activator)
LGSEVTDDLLAQFPPDGWGDVARSQDLVSVNARIDQVEARMTSIETRMTSLEAKVDQVETHMTALETRMTSLENEVRVKFTSMENHIGVLDGRMKLMITGGIALIGIVLAIQVQTLFVMTGL